MDTTPVVIGVGDFINRSKQAEDAIEPLQLMLNAVQEAFKDTGLSAKTLEGLRGAVDSLDVVRTWTWPYPDLPGLISERLGINPQRKHYTDHGGNQPGVIFDGAARRISKGETKVAILTGGEALASCKVGTRRSATTSNEDSIRLCCKEAITARWVDSPE